VKNIILLFFIVCQISNAFSQETVKIVTYGSGKTYESALSIALRSSLEQAAGVFISNMAIVKNDSLIYDEVKSISNGTITKYYILAKVFDSANAIHTLTIEAEIVPEKFISFAKSINNSIEFNGNAFVQNIKLNEINKINEPFVLWQFLSQYFVADSSLNLFMDGWHKLYDKSVKVVGNEPFKYKHEQIELNLLRLTGSSWEYGLTKEKFISQNWLKRRRMNFIIADQIIKSDRDVVKIGEVKQGEITTMNYKSSLFDFDGFQVTDSLYIIHNIIDFYNSKFPEKYWFDETDTERLKLMNDRFGIKDYLFEGKTYRQLTDYWYYRLHYWINNLYLNIEKLDQNLKAKEGYFVFNLLPILKPNENYFKFIEQLEQIIKSLSVNKENEFDQTKYENSNEKLYPVYFADLGSLYKSRKYLVRNEQTNIMFKNIASNLHIYASGGQVFADKLLQRDSGLINTYITGKYTNSEFPVLNFYKKDFNTIISNPQDQYSTVGVFESGYVKVGLRFLVVMSAFLSKEELSQLRKFIIVSPN